MLYYENKFTDENGEFKYYTNPVKAIRAKCLYDCCAGDLKEVDECNNTKCFLYPFKNGKNPYRTSRQLNEEEKERIRNTFKKYRENNMCADQQN